MPNLFPGDLEVYSQFSQHLGPRFEAPGLSVQFHWIQLPGLHFKVRSEPDYEAAIQQGITEAMAAHFPDFPKKGSIWVTKITAHEIDSSVRAFYLAAQLVIEQAYSLRALREKWIPAPRRE